jgi:taurine dioxygenase
MATLVGERLEADGKNLDPKTISIDPLTPVIGAVIGKVDLSKPLSPEQFGEIRDAFNAYHVLVFRDQVLTRDDHKRFARKFGKIHVHPYHAKGSAPDHAKGGNIDPEILIVKADQNSKAVAGEEWHTDVTCDAEPPLGSMLYITKTPEIGGGDTCFLSTIRAYDTLSPAMKEIVLKLTATHDGGKLYTKGYGTEVPEGGWPMCSHPVVIRHPDTGRLSLFVNRGFTSKIDGFTEKESDAVLEMLWRHIEDHVEFQCRVRWYPNTLTFWDNRVTQHHSVWDYYPHPRYGERVSIIGARPSQ